MTYFWNLHWTSGIAKVKGDDPDPQPEQDRAAVRDRQVRRPGAEDLPGPRDARLARQHDRTRSAGPTRTTRASSWSSSRSGSGTTPRPTSPRLARALTGWTGPELQPATPATTRRPSSTSRHQHDDGIEDDPRADRQLGRVPTRSASSSNLTDSAGSVSGPLPRREALVLLRGRRPRRTTSSTSSSPSTPRSGRSIREVVRAIFLHDEFYAAHTRKTWVRSPVEYAVASVRMLEAHERLLVGRQLARRHGSGALQPVRRQGLGLGHLLDEHRVALRARHAQQHAGDQPRARAARASTRPRSSPARTRRRPTRSWTCSRRA